MLRLMHLVQGLSYTKQGGMQWSTVYSPSTVQEGAAVAAEHSSPLDGDDKDGVGLRGEKEGAYIRGRMSYAASVQKANRISHRYLISNAKAKFAACASRAQAQTQK